MLKSPLVSLINEVYLGFRGNALGTPGRRAGEKQFSYVRVKHINVIRGPLRSSWVPASVLRSISEENHGKGEA